MTEKRHLTDAELQNNMLPWFFLNDDTRARFKAWPHGVVFLLDGQWLGCPQPMWCDGLVYRAKPAPLTQDTVPWEQIPKWATAFVREEGEMAYVCELAPYLDEGAWMGGGRMARIDHVHVGYQHGTCHWKDSLQRRPEGV